MVKKLAALLLVLAILAGLLLHFVELLDDYCETDADCTRPTVCRLVCRRNCKSVCVLVVDELNGGGDNNNNNVMAAGQWTKRPELGVLIGPATQHRRKLHRRPPSVAAKSADEEPFETEANPFAAAAVSFKSPQAPLPPPPPYEKSNVPTTPLTISEAELEAELRQLTGPERGPSGFVTAPGQASGEDSRATTPDPFELTRGINSRESLETAPPPPRLRGNTQSTGQQLMLSTSMELVGDLAPFRQRTTQQHFTTVSPPSFSPQPPGFMPSQTTPSRTMSNNQPTTTTSSSSSSTTSRFTSTQRATSTTTTAMLGRQPPGERSSKEGGGEQLQLALGGHNNKAAGPYYRPLCYKSAEEHASPWLPKTPLPIRPPVTMSPLLVAMRRTTQRVPSHRPFGGGSTTSTSTAGSPTTMRTTLRRCAPPPVCGRNCGVVIDADGCQSCQCLWFSPRSCFSDVDCRAMEGQVCDLGRCECGPGYEHHAQQSGVCQRVGGDIPARQRGVTLSQSSPIPPSPTVAVPLPSSLLVSGRSLYQVPSHRQFHHYQSMMYRRQMRHRLKRMAAEQKPRREERLQWPGPCDRDEQCPPQLYCVQGDCWTLEPERALERRKDFSAAAIGGVHASALVRTAFPQQKPSPLVGSALLVQRSPSNGIGTATQTTTITTTAAAAVADGPSSGEKEPPRSPPQHSQSPITPPLAAAPPAADEKIAAEEEADTGTAGAGPADEYPGIDTAEADYAGRKDDSNQLAESHATSFQTTTTMSFSPSTTFPTSSDHSSPSSWPVSSLPPQTVALPVATVPLNANRPRQRQQHRPTQVHLPHSPSARPASSDSTTVSSIDESTTTTITTTPVPPVHDELRRVSSSPLGTSSEGENEPQLNTALVPTPDLPPLSANEQQRPKHRGLEQIQVDSAADTSTEEEQQQSGGEEKRRIFYDYSRHNRIRRPIRVEMANSREFIKDECREGRDCGRRFVCCVKRWCDLGGECGLAKFCLPSCELTKLAHLSELAPGRRPQLDLVYD